MKARDLKSNTLLSVMQLSLISNLWVHECDFFIQFIMSIQKRVYKISHEDHEEIVSPKEK